MVKIESSDSPPPALANLAKRKGMNRGEKDGETLCVKVGVSRSDDADPT